MRILLTGASGFTGSHVLRLLLEQNIVPRCLARSEQRAGELAVAGVEIVYGDIGDVDSMRRALDGIDVLINTASLGFGHAPAMMEAVDRSRPARAVFISTTALFTKLPASTKAVRLAAEERIAASPIDFTVLRPTIIYGTHRDRNLSRLLRFVARSPVIPVVGSGDGLLRPIHVDDLARAVIDVLSCSAASRKAYNLSGGTAVTFRELVQMAGRVLEKRVRLLPIPMRPAVALTRAAERIGLRLPIKSEQLLHLEEDKAFVHDEAAADFGFRPRPLTEGLRSEAVELGLIRG